MTRRTARQLLDSPVAMSWFSTCIRLLQLALLTPIVVASFSSEDFRLWQLLVLTTTAMGLFDAGFGLTYARFFAYSVSSADDVEDIASGSKASEQRSARERMGVVEAHGSEIFATARATYRVLVPASVVCWGPAVALAFHRPVLASSDATASWLSLAIVGTAICIRLLSAPYVSLLQGCHQIAMWRRWEGGIGAVELVVTILLVVGGGNLIMLVAPQMVGAAISYCVFRTRCRNLIGERWRSYLESAATRQVFLAVWNQVWRTSVGLVFAIGTPQFVIYMVGQLDDIIRSATILLLFQVMRAAARLGDAHFYSRLPEFATAAANAGVQRLTPMIIPAMRRSLVVFLALGLLGNVVLLLAAPYFENLNVPAAWIVATVSLAVLIDRYSSMRMQMHTVATNSIRWHLTGLVTCVTTVIVALLLVRSTVMELPYVWALLAGNAVGFLASFGYLLSVMSLRDLLDFEARVGTIPAALAGLYCLVILMVWD